jgi:hypothetical protein
MLKLCLKSIIVFDVYEIMVSLALILVNEKDKNYFFCSKFLAFKVEPENTENNML